MLVDHADPLRDGVRRRRDGDWLAAEQDLALVGRDQAVQDVHQRRLAGAVLAKERVDLASTHVEVDVVVRDHAGEAFGHAAHLQRRRTGRRLGHDHRSSSR